MQWLDEPGFERRPLVFVEDHLYHTTELVSALASARPGLLEHLTICGVDRPGPDTAATVRDWLDRYPRLQVAAAVDNAERLMPVDAGHLADATSFAKLVARLLRPGGILVQDVQLSTLSFLPADRWWESIYVAATVRGLFASRPPDVRFLSNKRGYEATFGRDLGEAGFDPRDVMDKGALGTAVVPTILSLFDRAFPLTLDARLGAAAGRQWRVGASDDERRDVEEALDVVLWPTPQGWEIGGRLVGPAAGGRVPLRSGSAEAETWSRLLQDRLDGGEGLPVVSVGERIGPPDAERAELTNIAARHLHTLRGRLRDASKLATVNHAYRFSEATSVGIVRKEGVRPSFSLV
jgi:hypothetical protein